MSELGESSGDDSSTFVRKSTERVDDAPDEGLDTGTFVHKPSNAPTSQNTNLDSSSVVRTPAAKQPLQTENTSNFKKIILKTMFTEGDASASTKGNPTDITSTIQRGNKKG